METEAIQHLFEKKIEHHVVTQEVKERSPLQVTGLSGSAKTMFIESFYDAGERMIGLVVPNVLHGQKVYDELKKRHEDAVHFYPAEELIAAEMSVSSFELRAERIDTLTRLARGESGIYIIPVAGLKKWIEPKDKWLRSLVTLRVGETYEWEPLLESVLSLGYERVDMVTAPGEFAMRGGILDIYPLQQLHPLRIEFFDIEVDSIREFSAETQRSFDPMEEAMITPAKEWLYSKATLFEMARGAERALAERLESVRDEAFKEKLMVRIESEIEQMRQGIPIEAQLKYISYAEEPYETIAHYFEDDALFILDEPVRIEEVAETLELEETEWMYSLVESGTMPLVSPVTANWSDAVDQFPKKQVNLSLFQRQRAGQKVISYSCKPMQQFHGQMHILQAEMERWEREQFDVIVTVSDEERKAQVEQILIDYDLSHYLGKRAGESGRLEVVIGFYDEGFELPLQQFALVTDRELFKGKPRRTRSRSTHLTNAERIKSYSEINPGDYVVHIEHGIGRYRGINTLEVGGVNKDYLEIAYRDGDSVYVPVDKIDFVQKYVASGDKEPKLHKLGGAEWTKTKRKVSSAVQDIADELIKLYAKREAEKGYAFSEDDDLQQSFESAFPYEETDDQLRSIEEIKRDMERERPMDRLLCGDVGYGKTEVALRAAFKAIREGKQVAFLVPTTILAQQHYETMIERFRQFPVTVGILNRFRTKKEQDETLRDLKAGVIDIVVGTHRLLSKDVQFQDLGLLIVDEEQRFGVTHKEKIKQMKVNVDVLTLTATPIPRTLHMSMVGVRDLSVIETPPSNRFPVQTYVMEHNLGLVREAIEREMARGGQVFYLYNRVEDMMKRVDEIEQLVPGARVTYAHGQMSETALESVILSFLEGEYDVLVTTTIIETGIDIPNVNTLIVHDADKMGLSQLYQLRGRVGRSNRVAYAYFLYGKDKMLTEVAENRLQAIKEFTELGSGFKIAMRDLSIRGAGNLLGAQQHGFIDSVGFDMYSQMLQDAIEEKTATPDEKESVIDVEISLPVDAYLPDTYIPDSFQKIQMYKRIKALDSIQAYDDLIDEMIDRFGEFPYEVDLLLRIARLRVWSKQANIQSIKKRRSITEVQLTEEGTSRLDGEKFVRSLSTYGRAVGFSMKGAAFVVTIDDEKIGKQTDFDVLEEIVQLLVASQANIEAD